MKLNIATILFTYNRPEHTRQVVEALSKNTILPEKLYIFHDGKKESTNVDAWNRVNEVIHTVQWCEKEIIVSDRNKGLADSIVDGINHVLQSYDAVIVLEDDIVTHPQFMEYMTSALEKYKDSKDVWNINGYSEGIVPPANGADAYFVGRGSSWGWATWKDRWRFFNRDYRIIARMKQNPRLNEQIHIWGEDIENYIIGNVTGKCNSWAAFWDLNIIEHGGYCLAPYVDFVKNIGCDGSGVHCGISDVRFNFRPFDEIKSFILPDKIEFPKNYETIFHSHWHRTSRETKLACYNKILLQFLKVRDFGRIADYLLNAGISKVVVWGRGNICKLLLEALREREALSVLAIVESSPRLSDYEGIPVKSAAEIPAETQLIICIPVYDIEIIESKLKRYGEYRIIGLDRLLEDVCAVSYGKNK